MTATNTATATATTPAAAGDRRDRMTTATAAATRSSPPAATALHGHGRPDGDGGRHGSLATVRWVLDPEDDHACTRALSGLHDLDAGRVVCHTSPAATWPVLVRDLLGALGKDRDALTRDGRVREGAVLLERWLAAETVHSMVVLRAHTLSPAVLDALIGLAARTGVTAWLVWHGRRPPGGHLAIAGSAQQWAHVVARLAPATAGPGARPPAGERVADLYGHVRAEARREARSWALGPPRIDPRHHQPGCPLGALLQRLTIDAFSCDELLVRMHAAQTGFGDEGLRLDLPAATDPDLLAALGPRLDTDTVARLRRIACPTTAAALLLAVVTDAGSASVARISRYWTAEDGSHVRPIGGSFLIPAPARPILRAAIIGAGQSASLLRGRDDTPLSSRRMATRIRQAAERVGLPVPPAGQRASTCWDTAVPFAAAFTRTASITPDDES